MKRNINTDKKNCLYPEDCFMYTYAAPDLYATDESPVAPMIAFKKIINRIEQTK